MTALDDELGPLAVELLDEYGKTVSLIRVVVGTYDPTTSASTKTETTSTLKALVEDFKPYAFANGLAVVGDKKLTVAAFGLTIPNMGDGVVIDSARYAIIGIESVNSGDNAALYILHGRKS
jgi:hypothetical protein